MIGTTIGPYRITTELGSGGMGTVFRADGPGGIVALKIVHEHVVATPGFLERFVREGEIGKSVRHENVVATLATGCDGNRHWIALEYVDGRTLRALAEELGKVPEALCRHVGREIAKGLAALHQAGLVHRDLKPENVLVTRDHVVKVMDLGIARGAADDQRMTQTGLFVGSLQYAAPEQFTGGGKGLDGRADQHALGATLYELATGVHPFLDEDVPQTLRRVLHETPRRAGEVNPQVSPFFEEVLRTLLEKDRARRFRDAAEVQSVLEQGEDGPWWRERSIALRAATRRPLRRMRIPRETALCGRDAELALLRSAFARAAEGSGQVVLVEGEAGIGKSRLLDEFVGLLESRGDDVNYLFGGYPPGGAATVSGAFSDAYCEQFGEEGSRAHLAGIPTLVHAFDALLRGEPPPNGEAPLSKDALQTCFVRSTQSLAKERPTIVVIDDLHFAPDEGRALFASLAMGVPGHRVLLVGTVRPGVDGKWLGSISRLDHATRIALPRLGAADLVRLLTDSLRSPHLAEDLAGRIAARSDGNPFFVFEILRGLRDGKFLTQRADGTWATTRLISGFQVPSSIADMIQARVSELEADDRNVLEVASALGHEFDPTLVGEVLGIARIPVLQRLGAIEKATRLVRAAGRRFVFDHHQIQEHLYAGISEVLREEYHAAIAEAIESRTAASGTAPAALGGAICADLCEHSFRGGRGTRALPHLDGALTHLEACAQNAAAVELAAMALAAPGLVTGSRRVDLLLRRAERLDYLGMRDLQRAALDDACAAAAMDGDPRRRMIALRARGWLHARSSEVDAARADLTAAVALAGELGDRVQEAGAIGELGSALWTAGRHAEARVCAERQLAIAQEHGEGSNETAAHNLLGNVCDELGRFEDVLAHRQRAYDISQTACDARRRSILAGNLGNALFRVGRVGEARARMTEALALAREIGDRRNETLVTGNLANTESALGNLETAFEMFDIVVTNARELGDRRTATIAEMNSANTLDQLGSLARALPRHESAHAQALLTGDDWLLAYAAGNLGYCLLHLGRTDAALLRFTAALEACDRLGGAAVRIPWLVGRGETLGARGDLTAACADLVAAASALRAPGLGESLAGALHALARTEVAAGDVPAATTAWREAADACRRDGIAPAGLLVDAHLATVAPADVATLSERFAEAAPRLPVRDRMEGHFALWRAGGAATELHTAARLLDTLVTGAPPEDRVSMVANIPLYRDVAAAASVSG